MQVCIVHVRDFYNVQYGCISGIRALRSAARILLPSLPHADEIKEHFVRFGPLTVDWPHKAQSNAYFPPKGVFSALVTLLFFFLGLP